MSAARLLPWQYAGLSPTQRTTRWLGYHGWTVEVVEKWVPGARVRRDTWSCDLLAAHPERSVMLVQACAGGVAERIHRVSEDEGAQTFVEAGGEVAVMGWRELVETGWTPRMWSMTEDRELELEEVLAEVPWQPRLVAS